MEKLPIEVLNQLKDELHNLRTKGRADIARQIAEARDKGDLSENAEYDAAKDAQGRLEEKIANLSHLIANAQILDKSRLDPTRVNISSTVKVKNMNNNAIAQYIIVSGTEADFKLGKISVESPIGKGLLGKKIGEIAEITIPSGKIKFEVLEVSL
jgi:transcription elongation factor GreA